jgi:L-arabinose transport system permease protein
MEDTSMKKNVRGVMLGLWDRGGMLVVFAILFACCSFYIRNFAGATNLLEGLPLSISTRAMVCCTMLFCLASGAFDLSVGSVVAFSGVVLAVTTNGCLKSGWSPAGALTTGIIVSLASGALVGFVNGIIIAKCKINALITTLATMQIVRGLAYIVSSGKSVGIGVEGFFELGFSRWLGLPTPVWIAIACLALFGFLISRTTYGRNTLAIGGNEEAARLAGIPVDRLKIVIFSAQGLMAAFAGIVLAARMTSGQPTSQQGFELEVISACVLGGVSLSGGVGGIISVIAGVLIMGTVQNAMQLKNVAPFYQYVANGLILLAAVLFDRLKQRQSGRG